MNMPTSTYYYKSVKKADKDKDILEKIESYCELVPEAGYRSVTAYLKKSMVINKKKVARIMKENGLLCRKKKGFKTITTDSAHSFRKYSNLSENFTPTSCGQLVVGDITAFDIKGKDHFLALLMDVYNREIIGYAIASRNNTKLALSALNMAKEKSLIPKGCIHHTDSDVRYCSTAYVATMENLELKISMCKGNAYENAFAESLNATVKRQEINVSEYSSLAQATESIERFIEIYNKIRPHSSIDGLSPKEKRSSQDS